MSIPETCSRWLPSIYEETMSHISNSEFAKMALQAKEEGMDAKSYLLKVHPGLTSKEREWAEMRLNGEIGSLHDQRQHQHEGGCSAAA